MKESKNHSNKADDKKERVESNAGYNPPPKEEIKPPSPKPPPAPPPKTRESQKPEK